MSNLLTLVNDVRQKRAKSTQLRICSQKLRQQSLELIFRSQKLLVICQETIDSLYNLQGLKILVVDDSDECLVLMTYVLEFYKVQVMTASSALIALNLIQKYQFDILISDLSMPEEDGYSLIQKVKKLNIAEKRNIPVIAVTARCEEETRELALAYGFAVYLKKPLDLNQLIKEIANLSKMLPKARNELVLC